MSTSRQVHIWDVIDEDALAEYVAWNAPDYEHVRITLRRVLEEKLNEAIDAHAGIDPSTGGTR